MGRSGRLKRAFVRSIGRARLLPSRGLPRHRLGSLALRVWKPLLSAVFLIERGRIDVQSLSRPPILDSRGGNGLPAFAYRDVGVVVLDEPVYLGEMAELPPAGLVDTLRNKTDVDLVGYGVTDQVQGLPPSVWTGLRNRLFAPSELVSGNFVHSAEFMRLTANPGGGTGGLCFGDSGGPDLLAGTDTVLAVNSYVTSYNCSGVTYSSRVDIPEILDWIHSFL